MELQDVMDLLQKAGNEQTKRICINHGAKEPLFGVKYGDIKKIYRKIKKDHHLSIELYNTGNSDAMVLASCIADEKQISKETLWQWAERANWCMLSEYSVAMLAAETYFGWEIGLEWTGNKKENIASCGWATLTGVISIRKNEDIDLKKANELLITIGRVIHLQQNRVRYTMNNFVIGVGSYIPDLSQKAMDIAVKIGKVHVDMGNTSCKVPYAPDYIQKVADKNKLGIKRKRARY